jgi:hypothetical protein
MHNGNARFVMLEGTELPMFDWEEKKNWKVSVPQDSLMSAWLTTKVYNKTESEVRAMYRNEVDADFEEF